MTDYRLWPATNGPASDAGDVGTQINLGTEFYVAADASVSAIHYWRPTTAVAAATQGVIWRVASTAVVAGTLVTFTDPGTDTGWLTATVDPAIALTPDDRYVVAVHFADNYSATGAYWTSGAGSAGITNAPLTAPSNADATGNKQGRFSFGTFTTNFPDTTFGGNNYWVDVTVSTVGGGDPPSPMDVMDVQGELNRIAGTTGLAEAGAANAYAGTSGLETVGALNVAAGNSLIDYKDLQGVANQLAGTVGLGTPLALSMIS